MSDDNKPDPFAPFPLDESLMPTNPPIASPPQLAGEAVPVRETVADPGTWAPDRDAQPAYSSEPPVEAPPLMVEEPLLPEELSLADAMGLPPVDGKKKQKKEKKRTKTRNVDDDHGGLRAPRTGALVAAIAIVAGAGIAALVLLGRVNSTKLVMKCRADSVSVEHGRSFPPWGTRPLDEVEWTPVKIPPEAQCVTRVTESRAELAGWFAKLLEDQATAALTAREVASVDEAERNLKQALLVSRSLGSDDARIDLRARVERLLGDVTYWRASAKLRAAADALGDAAKEFDAAALQKPRYVTDAAAWGDYVRKLTTDLKLGPAGAKTGAFPPLPPGEKSAPMGSELPVEPRATPPGVTPSEGEPEPAAPDPARPTGGVVI